MFKVSYVVATIDLDGETLKAEYDPHSGRLRILAGQAVQEEWFPPHSWFAIACAAGGSSWGTRPTEADLQKVISDFAVHQKMAATSPQWSPGEG
ncbi:hypothetical protein [Paraburkholderia fungorum]